MVTRVLSREDGQLDTPTIRVSRAQVFKDIDLSFTVNVNGELYVKRDAAAVKQAVQNLILTNYYEKPFQPFYGSNVTARLFELVGLVNDDIMIANEITRAIEAYEPRAQVVEVTVQVEPDQNSMNVDIEFRIVNSDEIVQFSTTLSRLR